MELPTHCWDCGAYLMGGTTKHEPGCEVQRMIDDAMNQALDRAERKLLPENNADEHH